MTRQPERSFRLESLGRITRPLRRSVIGKFPALNNLLEHWPDLAGAAVAPHTLPLRLVPQRQAGDKNTPDKKRSLFILHLQVKPAFAPLLQHELPALQQRLNQFLGYQAIHKITLHQAPPDPWQRPVLRPLSPGEQQKLGQMTEQITDPVLRDAIKGLGSALLRQKK